MFAGFGGTHISRRAPGIAIGAATRTTTVRFRGSEEEWNLGGGWTMN